MTNNPKRILCIVGSMDAGGAETFLMKLYRSFDRTQIQFDFYVSSPHKGLYEDEIVEMGGKIFRSFPKSKGVFKSLNRLKRVVKQEEYHYVMRVSQHSLSALDLIVAKMGGAKHLIYRSSNSKTGGGSINQILHKVFKFLPMFVPTLRIAPSTEAAEFMFGKRMVKKNKVHIVKNGIPLDIFDFNLNTRILMRKELNINDSTLLIGHVGRFVTQKNHLFLIKIFDEILKKNEDSILILVGIGELETKIKDTVIKHGLEKKVRFLGVRKDVPDLMMAMDLFIFPSFYEGMPNTVIESQATGLPCVISDQITKEVQITPHIKSLSLSSHPKKWAEVSISLAGDESRSNSKIYVEEKGYSIKKSADKFKELVF